MADVVPDVAAADPGEHARPTRARVRRPVGERPPPVLTLDRLGDCRDHPERHPDQEDRDQRDQLRYFTTSHVGPPLPGPVLVPVIVAGTSLPTCQYCLGGSSNTGHPYVWYNKNIPGSPELKLDQPVHLADKDVKDYPLRPTK